MNHHYMHIAAALIIGLAVGMVAHYYYCNYYNVQNVQVQCARS